MTETKRRKVVKALSKEPRFHHGTYELCATIDGERVYVFSASADACREKFAEELLEKVCGRKAPPPPKEEPAPKVTLEEFAMKCFGELLMKACSGKERFAPKEEPAPKVTYFEEFAMKWFEEIHKAKVVADTYDKDIKQYRRHIEPHFAGKPIEKITTADCMLYHAAMKKLGIERTHENCDGLLRQIFDFAVASDLIPKNPLGYVKRVKSKRKNGVPLTYEEERQFVSAMRGSRYEPVFALGLYAGLRPCELESVTIEGNFIVARNRKQKDVTVYVYKKIPITPMLRPYLPKIEASLDLLPRLTRSNQTISENFKKFCPNHRLYDLRTTFASRTQECGVQENVVQVWMGHVPSTLLGRVYTKFSEEFMLREAQKVKY